MKYSLIKHYGNPQTTLFCSRWLNAQGVAIPAPIGLDSKAAAEGLAARFGAKVVAFTAAEFALAQEPQREY